jgi:integrase
MAIREYVSFTGETLYKVNVHVRSSRDPSFRIQKQKEGIENSSDAKKIEAKLLREAERDLIQKESRGNSWEQVIEAFEHAMRKASAEGRPSLQDDSLIDYVAALHNWTPNWFKKPASEITSNDVREVLDQVKVAGRSGNFQARMKIIINRVFTYGIESRLIRGVDKSPTFGVVVKRKGEPVPDILSSVQIQKLLMLGKQYEPDWYFIWALAVYTGMRNGELYALLWTDVDWANRAIHVTKSYNSRQKAVKSTKSGYWRDVPISSELELILKELKLRMGSQPQVLPRPREWQMGMQAQALRKFCLQVGLPSIRFHALRACFATQLLRNGIAPITVMKMCGWKDLKTMQHYIRLSGIEVNGATEVLKFHTPAETMEVVSQLFGHRKPSVDPDMADLVLTSSVSE